MPIGKPNAQTIASEKYQKKAGYISKSYKLKKEIVEQFQQACEKQGVSQAGKIMELMQAFVKETTASEE